jgi:hypothetical protein
VLMTRKDVRPRTDCQSPCSVSLAAARWQQFPCRQTKEAKTDVFPGRSFTDFQFAFCNLQFGPLGRKVRSLAQSGSGTDWVSGRDRPPYPQHSTMNVVFA